MTDKTIHEKLVEIQQALKVPKNNKNTFGNYNYRSCEDILEAVKPLLGECSLTINDEVVNIGERYYIKATVLLAHDKDVITAVAYAREPEIKKGMDEAQITGATSSYARKYALNGLFAIDDTKDADSMDNRATEPQKPAYKDDAGIVHEPYNGTIAKPVQPIAEEHFCTIHKKPMKQRTSTQGGTWYDHRWQVNGVWQQCNGKPKAEVIEEEPEPYPNTDY